MGAQDAGKYVIHFGRDAGGDGRRRAGPKAVPAPAGRYPDVTPVARFRTGVAVAEGGGADGGAGVLQVARSLDLAERALVLAAAVSIDFDFFSRHAHAGPGVPFPFFFPGFGGSRDDLDDEAAAGGEAPAGGEALPNDEDGWGGGGGGAGWFGNDDGEGGLGDDWGGWGDD